ncbi:hypothetical protein DPEC_G00375170, partial [Dallia pectoralis]
MLGLFYFHFSFLHSTVAVFIIRSTSNKMKMMMMKPLFMVLLLSATKELMRTGLLCDASLCQSCTRPKVSNLYVREGEMAVLRCRKLWVCRTKCHDGNVTLTWNNHSGPGREEFGDTLVILRVSPNNQGSYSCSLIKSKVEEATLVIKQVSEEHLNRNYTCKLQSTSVAIHASITFKQKRPARFHLLILIVVGTFVITALVVTVVYVKLKVDIVLFLRDDLGLHHHKAYDGKCYDAYVLCCKSDMGSGVSEEDRRNIEAVLEEEYGYSLCLFDRDILPGQ